MEWWYFNLPRIDPNVFSINLAGLDDCMAGWKKTSKFGICSKLAPSVLSWFLLPSPVGGKEKLHSIPMDGGENCSNPSNDLVWSFVAPIPGETQKKTVLEMFCTPHCVRCWISSKKIWTKLWVGYEFINNNEKKPSNLHVLCDFASNSVQLFPQCRKLRRRTAERSVATHKHGTTVDFGGTYIEFSQETTWFMRHLLRCLVREKRCKVEWRKLLRCCLLMTLGLSFFKKQM